MFTRSLGQRYVRQTRSNFHQVSPRLQRRWVFDLMQGLRLYRGGSGSSQIHQETNEWQSTMDK